MPPFLYIAGIQKRGGSRPIFAMIEIFPCKNSVFGRLRGCMGMAYTWSRQPVDWRDNCRKYRWLPISAGPVGPGAQVSVFSWLFVDIVFTLVLLIAAWWVARLGARFGPRGETGCEPEILGN